MRIGVCAPPDRFLLIRELGYDYIDLNFSWLASLDEATLAAVRERVEASGMSVESTNGFFGDVTLFPAGGTPAMAEALLAEIAAYAERGLARAAALGGRVAVIGSGRQRSIPDGYPRERAEAEFARILSVCGEIADRHGMRVAVEPLSARETNYLHTVAEGAAVARASGCSAVGAMVDFYHLWANGDDLASLPALGDTLIHAHLARPGDRNAPLPEDAETLRAWASTLARCPSVERISLECIWAPDFDTAVRTATPLMAPFRAL